jgi:hypothetical protein
MARVGEERLADQSIGLPGIACLEGDQCQGGVGLRVRRVEPGRGEILHRGELGLAGCRVRPGELDMGGSLSWMVLHQSHGRLDLTELVRRERIRDGSGRRGGRCGGGRVTRAHGALVDGSEQECGDADRREGADRQSHAAADPARPRRGERAGPVVRGGDRNATVGHGDRAFAQGVGGLPFEHAAEPAVVRLRHPAGSKVVVEVAELSQQ